MMVSDIPSFFLDWYHLNRIEEIISEMIVCFLNAEINTN